MAPDAALGIAVLTNQESGEAFDSIAFRILDHYLGVQPFDWIAAFKKVHDRIEARTAEADKQNATARDQSSKPSLPLARYAGTYRDGWYGDVAITMTGGTLAIRFTRTPALEGSLEHWQHDTFVARWRDRELRADAFVSFALKPDGSIDQIRMTPVSPSTDFSFDFQDLLLKPAAPSAPRP
jgi:hypothetical protein